MHPSTPQYSDEQWAAIGDPNVPAKLKRLAAAMASIGLFFGVVAILGLLFSWHGLPAWRLVSLDAPPSPIAASFSFVAIGFGVISFWALKQIPGKRAARVVGVISVLLGLAGVPIFTVQAFQVHVQLERGEIEKCSTLTHAALTFQERENHFPRDLLELVQSAHLGPDSLKTTFASTSTLSDIPAVAPHDPGYASALRHFEDQSDFVYLAGNLNRRIPPLYQSKIIIVRSLNSHLESQSAAVGFADGTVRWLSMVDAPELYKNDSDARAAIGAPPRPEPAPPTQP